MLELPRSDRPSVLDTSDALTFLEAHVPYQEDLKAHVYTRDLVDKIADHQEELRDAREKVIGVRFRLRSKRKELQVTRTRAAVQAGSAFDLIRRYFLEKGVDIPENIHNALEAADVLRDLLGEQEVEYEIAEKDYDFAEWEYTEKEQNFVDDILTERSVLRAPDTSSPGTRDTLGYSGRPLSVHELDQLSFRHSQSGEQEGVSSEREGQSRVEVYPDVLATHPDSLLASIYNDAISEKDHPASPEFGDETEMSDAKHRWSITRKRIEEWIWEGLRHSGIHKALLQNFVPKTLFDSENFLQLVKAHWDTDETDSVAFHTGDTIVSDVAISESISVPLTHNLSNGSSVSNVENQSTRKPATPLVSLDRIEKALENKEFPSDINASDLIDSTSDQVISRAQSPSIESDSSRHTVETSCITDGSSKTSAEEDHASSTVSTKTVRLGNTQTSHDLDVLVAHHKPGSDTLDVGFQVPSDLDFKDKPSISLSDQSDDVSMVDLEAANTRPADGRGLSKETLRYNATTDILPISTPDLVSLGDSDMNTSQSLPLSGKPLFFEPFIWISGSKPWALPLVRLTPLPSEFSTPRVDNANPSSYLPFVYGSGSPFPFPGPSELS
jgi:hypothetical protein